jgi:hypothetical protein
MYPSKASFFSSIKSASSSNNDWASFIYNLVRMLVDEVPLNYGFRPFGLPKIGS